MGTHRTHLCVGIIERDARILLVGNQYSGRAELLWNLPGGRQEPGESCAEAVVREFFEETNLHVRVTELAYVAESIDSVADVAFTTFAFHVEGDTSTASVPANDSVRALEWIAHEDLADRLTVRVIRDPLLAYFAHGRRYTALGEAGITIAFDDEPAR